VRESLKGYSFFSDSLSIKYIDDGLLFLLALNTFKKQSNHTFFLTPIWLTKKLFWQSILE